jgi:predicted MFS family arabinose efflux permease
LGAALASAVTAFIASTLGWRAAFVIPGLSFIAVGIAFLAMVPGDGDMARRDRQRARRIELARPSTLLLVFAIAIIAGGMTFNITTISAPQDY